MKTHTLLFSYMLSFDFYRVVKYPNKMLVKSNHISRENQKTLGWGVLIRKCIRIERSHTEHHFLSDFQLLDIFSEQTTLDDNIGSNTRRY